MHPEISTRLTPPWHQKIISQLRLEKLNHITMGTKSRLVQKTEKQEKYRKENRAETVQYSTRVEPL